MGRWRRKSSSGESSRSFRRHKHKHKDEEENPQTTIIGEISPGSADSNNTVLSSNTSYRKVTFDEEAASHKHRHFTTLEKEQLKKYLQEYKQNALEGMGGEGEVVVIGGIEFPALTEDVCGALYLQLPKKLSGKQRRSLHEICFDVGLYHDSINETTEPTTTEPHRHHYHNRSMVVSVHPNGLSHIPSPPCVPIQHCPAWYYQQPKKKTHEPEETPQKDNRSIFGRNAIPCAYVQEQTHGYRIQIQTLVENPGLCIRDAHDFWEQEEGEEEDLSWLGVPQEDHGWMLVDSKEKMEICVEEIMQSQPSELGFDLEMYNPSKYACITCLLQLSTETKSYVIDPFRTWKHIHLLGPIFSNPSIVKIGHSIHSMDIPALYRDFGIVVMNAFDTMEAAKALEVIPKVGLASLCEYYNISNPKEYSGLKDAFQRQDWRKRPLTEPMIRYARYDVFYLIALRRLLIRDLCQLDRDFSLDKQKEVVVDSTEINLLRRSLAYGLRDPKTKTKKMSSTNASTTDDESSAVSSNASEDEGYFTPLEDDSFDSASESNSPAPSSNNSTPRRTRHLVTAKELRNECPTLLQIIQKSQKHCLAFHHHKPENGMKCDTLKSVLKKEGPRWTPSQTLLYQHLIQWRDSVAQRFQTMSGLVCTTEFLVYVAYKLPVTLDDLRIVHYHLPNVLEECQDALDDLLQLVKDFKEKDAPAKAITPIKKIPPGIQQVTKTSSTEVTVHQIKTQVIDKVEQTKRRSKYIWKVSAAAAVGVAVMMFMRRRRR